METDLTAGLSCTDEKQACDAASQEHMQELSSVQTAYDETKAELSASVEQAESLQGAIGRPGILTQHLIPSARLLPSSLGAHWAIVLVNSVALKLNLRFHGDRAFG